MPNNVVHLNLNNSQNLPSDYSVYNGGFTQFPLSSALGRLKIVHNITANGNASFADMAPGLSAGARVYGMAPGLSAGARPSGMAPGLRARPSAANLPSDLCDESSAADTSTRRIQCASYVSHDRIAPLLKKKRNLQTGTPLQHGLIIQGLRQGYGFPMLEALLGTDTQLGVIQYFSPEEQLRQLIEVMDRFSSMEKNQRLFIFQRMREINVVWQSKSQHLGQISFLRGSALNYFCRNCLAIYPAQQLTEVYDFMLQIMPNLAPAHCNKIVSCLIKNFYRLCQNTSSDKHYVYFKELLKAAFRCSADMRCQNLSYLSKTLSFLPANQINRAARLIGLATEECMPKASQKNIMDNVLASLRNHTLRHPINVLNFRFYSQVISPIAYK
ncbi:hypothetical protein ABK905_17720 [Acerihabitans sp. KWT182]|uniref:Uncharacterized protein n=1 Tax=Acerihabitans sp. KWT182 TaxID=3157919 RepID=A0AAU7Q6H4_9GAMM